MTCDPTRQRRKRDGRCASCEDVTPHYRCVVCRAKVRQQPWYRRTRTKRAQRLGERP